MPVKLKEMTVRFDGVVPKKLQAFANKRQYKVREVTGIGVLAENAYDVDYRPGWKSGSDMMGAVHSDSAPTISGLIWCINTAVHCDCDECAVAMREMLQKGN
jgi:hypothetical protein